MRLTIFTESRADWGGLEPVAREARAQGLLVDIVAHYEFEPKGWIYSKYMPDRSGDWMVVLGDRRRVLEHVLTCYEFGIGIAHLSGGDRQTGHLIDEPCRHAISKFAHVHFPNSDQSAKRLIRHGEDPRRIWQVGSTMVDDLRQFRPKKMANHREFNLILHHPAPGWRGELLDLAEKYRPCIVLEPNKDAGHGPAPEDLHYCVNVPREEFLQMLWNCKAFVGNSSAMFLEAQYLGTPCIHIGERNHQREESFPGHIASGKDARTEGGLREDWADGAHGNGTAAQQIIEVLQRIGKPDDTYLRKEWE